MKIYVDTPLTPELKQALRAETEADSVTFKDELSSDEERLQALTNADILFGNPRPAEWLQQAANLKWVQLYSTGFEYYRSVNVPAVVTNMQDYYSQPCAETIIGGIMALYRGVDSLTLLKQKQEWVGHSIRPLLNTLYGKRIIILGRGRIAKHLVSSLAGFQCSIKMFGRVGTECEITSVEQLESELPLADIVIACLPGTQETRGLITDSMIARFSSDCIFCNVGRGNIVANEQTLVDALINRRIAGAVLDVTEHEPIPPNHPLWTCPNTILTQHSGGGSATEYSGILELFLRNYRNWKEGKPLMNVVNLSRGY